MEKRHQNQSTEWLRKKKRKEKKKRTGTPMIFFSFFKQNEGQEAWRLRVI